MKPKIPNVIMVEVKPLKPRDSRSETNGAKINARSVANASIIIISVSK